MHQNCLLLPGWIIFHRMAMLHLVYSFADGQLGCFHLLAIRCKAAMDICARLFETCFQFCGVDSRSRTAGSWRSPCLPFWGTATLSSSAAAPFTLTSRGHDAPFRQSNTRYFLLFYLIAATLWCEVAPHCGSDLHFPKTPDVMCLLVIVSSFLAKST